MKHLLLCAALMSAAWFGRSELGSWGLVPLAPLLFMFLIPGLFSFKQPKGFLGWQRPEMSPRLVFALIILVLVLTGVVFLAFRTGNVADYYNQFNSGEPSLAQWLDWAVFAVVSCVVTEFFFRSFWLMGGMFQGLSTTVAVWTVFVGECVFHFSKPPLEVLGAGALSIVLSVLTIRTKSVWPAFGVHLWIELCFSVKAAGF